MTTISSLGSFAPAIVLEQIFQRGQMSLAPEHEVMSEMEPARLLSTALQRLAPQRDARIRRIRNRVKMRTCAFRISRAVCWPLRWLFVPLKTCCIGMGGCLYMIFNEYYREQHGHHYSNATIRALGDSPFLCELLNFEFRMGIISVGPLVMTNLVDYLQNAAGCCPCICPNWYCNGGQEPLLQSEIDAIALLHAEYRFEHQTLQNVSNLLPILEPYLGPLNLFQMTLELLHRLRSE